MDGYLNSESSDSTLDSCPPPDQVPRGAASMPTKTAARCTAAPYTSHPFGLQVCNLTSSDACRMIELGILSQSSPVYGLEGVLPTFASSASKRGRGGKYRTKLEGLSHKRSGGIDRLLWLRETSFYQSQTLTGVYPQPRASRYAFLH